MYLRAPDSLLIPLQTALYEFNKILTFLVLHNRKTFVHLY